MIPITGTTHSGILFFTWRQRFVIRSDKEGRIDGCAFQRLGCSRATAGDYGDDICSKLEAIQETTTLIDPECAIWEDYGVHNSGKGYFTTTCTIIGAELHLIGLVQARWRTNRANGEHTIQSTMAHTHYDVRNRK